MGEIAVLTGTRTISTSIDRVAGCRRALDEAGLELLEDRVLYGDYMFGRRNQADGHRMALEVLDAPGQLPTAMFCANNFIAFGAIRALRERGPHVPNAMSVVAFDDLPEEWVSEPFRTCAAQPAYDIGRRGAELLLGQVSGSNDPTGKSVVLPFEIIVRRSSNLPRVTTQGAIA